MYLLDTCSWIDWLCKTNFADKYLSYFKELNNIIVPTLIQFELYRWTEREFNMERALEVIGITEQAHVVGLDTSMALYAAQMSKEFKLSMADAIIYATAKLSNATLVTSDYHLGRLHGVEYLRKG